jgi:translation initiation factor IF-2
VNEEEVQKQIKETLARLTTKGKSKGSRYRREKREAISQKHQEVVDQQELDKNILKVTEFVSVNELASMMSIPVTDIISTCMSLGLVCFY